MTPLIRHLFVALILVQAGHSIEEYLFRLYEVFGPARWISGLFSSDLAAGFAIANCALVFLGVWCYLARVRTSHASGRAWAWFWAALEGANGTGHLALALGAGGYFPGAATAPVLLGLACSLAIVLARTAGPQRV